MDCKIIVSINLFRRLSSAKALSSFAHFCLPALTQHHPFEHQTYEIALRFADKFRQSLLSLFKL